MRAARGGGEGEVGNKSRSNGVHEKINQSLKKKTASSKCIDGTEIERARMFSKKCNNRHQEVLF